MSNTILIIGGLALVGGIAYYCYRRVQAKEAATKTTVSKEDLINNLAANTQAEKVEKLTCNDVVNYFKSLKLKKGVDVPFMAKITKEEGITSYLLAVYNEKTSSLSNGKLIAPGSIDEDLTKLLGNETLIVLT